MALVIRGGTIFHGDPPRRLEGDLVVEGGTVCEASDDVLEDARIVDAGGCLVLPGFVIAHHHLYSALARGMPAPDQAPANFVAVLESVWWRLDRALDGDLSELSAFVGSVEALRCGVTSIVDHHASPNAIDGSLDRVAAGVHRAGARAVLCYEATDRHGDDGFAAGFAENERFMGSFAGGTLRAMVGGHAPFTLSDAHLEELANMAARHDVALHLHVAEDAHDQTDAQARGASNVVERLERAGVLSGRSVLAHGVHLSETEIGRLTEAGAWLTHQPRSNMNNHVGYLGLARSHGARLALGTDGINGDILAEAQTAFFRLREHDRHGAAETVWSWLAGGWRLMTMAFGLPADRGFGCLDAGAPADVVVLDYDAPTPVTEDNLAWHLAFGIGARHVRDVIVGGELAVIDRRPARIDDATLASEARSGAERLWSRMRAL